MSIKENFERTDKLYHFTSFDTALKIIESNRLRFGRLSNMNDIHESAKNVFVGSSSTIKSFPSEVLDALYDDLYKYRQISLTANKKSKKGFDLHQMWGQYADKGEGVCLVFDKKELEEIPDMINIHRGFVEYEDSQILESYVISQSESVEDAIKEISNQVPKLFFHKRVEWEHEQEYRLLKKCTNANKEEYLLLGHALKYVILSSKLHNTDEVLYFKRIDILKAMLAKVEQARKVGEDGKIQILVYGNGLFDYSLSLENGEECIWSSTEGYDILIPGKNCEIC